MRRFLAALAIWLGLLAPAAAHELRPAYLEIREIEAGHCEVMWKSPTRGGMRLRLMPSFGEDLTRVSPTDQRMLSDALVERWQIASESNELGGQELWIEGLEGTMLDALVRIEFHDGRTFTKILRPESPSLTIPGGDGAAGVAWTYLTLGVEHILLGVDHLLFVLGLLWIVASRSMLLKTITSFTLAHSITLGIATLGYASAPGLPLNAAIALSILFLGPEIVRAWRGETSFTIRHPWVVAFAFGLLHGFGFASGLTTLGLPSQEIPIALLLFNVGVEIGQIAFVLLVILMERSFRTLEVRTPRWAALTPAYVVGSLGAFWTIQRTVVLMGGLR